MVQEETLTFFPIPNHPGYMISKCGKIYSKGHVKILKPTKHYRNSYESVNIRDSKKVLKRVNVHKLMCITFIDNDYISKGLVCNHKDGNKINNKLSNLEVVTRSENNIHAYKLGLTNPVVKLGEESNNNILKNSQVIDIFTRYHTEQITQQELAKLYKVDRTTISDITRGKNWKHLTKDIVL